MSYSIKEIFYTIQGEGINSGKPAVFVRFSGCNLWNGNDRDRYLGSGSCSSWCDTSFLGTDGDGGGRFETPELVAMAVSGKWKMTPRSRPFVVCTGGEPLLQLNDELITALHDRGFEIAIETNGTLPIKHNVDWVCVSPKAKSNIVVTKGDELKLVFPQIGLKPEDFEGLDFQNFLLQPKDDASKEENTSLALKYCLEHPGWRLSLQIHKYLGIH